MQGYEYIKTLVDDIHSTTVATIGSDGHPQTRIIDMKQIYPGDTREALEVFSLCDAQGEYFEYQ